MATQIQLTRSGSAGGSPPNATELEYGELALNYADGKLFFKNSSNQVEQLNSTYRNSGQKIFVNESDNHIGLNTTSPAFLLDLGGTSASADNSLRLNQNDDGTAIRIGGSAAGDITLLRVDNANGESANSAEGFGIKYLGSNNHELAIFADNSGTEYQALTILQDGKIGIGTGTPAKLLDIQGGSAQVSGNFSAGGDLTISGNTILGNATSDTASISGGLTVDTNTLVVDESNDRVGINQATPSVELDVSGSANVTQSLSVGATLTVTGSSTFGDSTTDTVTITGNAIAQDPTDSTHLTTKNYVDTNAAFYATLYNIGQGTSNKKITTTEILPSGESSLDSALWPDASALIAASTDREWSVINKYPMHASITTRRANSNFRISANCYGGVKEDDSCAITVSYNTGAYSQGSIPTGLQEIEPIVGDDESNANFSGHTFSMIKQDSDERLEIGHMNHLWIPGTGVAEGTTINFFLSLFGMNDAAHTIAFNSPRNNPNSGFQMGVYVSNIMVEEIYTQ